MNRYVLGDATLPVGVPTLDPQVSFNRTAAAIFGINAIVTVGIVGGAVYLLWKMVKK